MMNKLKLKTPLGSYVLIEDDGFLIRFQPGASAPLKTNSKVLNKAAKQLHEYFMGKRKIFDLPLKPEGTAFQKKVWNQLLEIPYGETWSYQDIAKGIKNPKAVRAVGGANGRNPLGVIIPCHRVVRKSGDIGGYSGGLSKKRKLLRIENAENF